MPSVTPLNNIKLQSSLNLNNQLSINTNRAKAYTLKNLSTVSPILVASDIGCLLPFSGYRYININANISGVAAGDSFFVAFFDGGFLDPAVGVTIVDSGDYSLGSANFNVFQLIYLGSNIWIRINTN
jgi:hypothetical protein